MEPACCEARQTSQGEQHQKKNRYMNRRNDYSLPHGRHSLRGLTIVRFRKQTSHPAGALRAAAQCSLPNNFTTAVMLRSPRFSSIALWNIFRTTLTVGAAASPPAVFTV